MVTSLNLGNQCIREMLSVINHQLRTSGPSWQHTDSHLQLEHRKGRGADPGLLFLQNLAKINLKKIIACVYICFGPEHSGLMGKVHKVG